MPARQIAIQRCPSWIKWLCCCSSPRAEDVNFLPEDERGPLLLNQGRRKRTVSELSLSAPAWVDEVLRAPSIGTAWDWPNPQDRGWESSGSRLNGKYDLYHNTQGNQIDVVATEETSNGEVVVATAMCTTMMKHDGLHRSSFSSNPPLAGLGSAVMRHVRQRAGSKSIISDNPLPGVYTLYKGMGLAGFTVDADTEGKVNNYLAGTKNERDQLKLELANKRSRERLAEIQKGIAEIERTAIMKGHTSYKPP
jgi:hypothetical protein